MARMNFRLMGVGFGIGENFYGTDEIDNWLRLTMMSTRLLGRKRWWL
jgi:hypothetical protein